MIEVFVVVDDAEGVEKRVDVVIVTIFALSAETVGGAILMMLGRDSLTEDLIVVVVVVC